MDIFLGSVYTYPRRISALPLQIAAPGIFSLQKNKYISFSGFLLQTNQTFDDKTLLKLPLCSKES